MPANCGVWHRFVDSISWKNYFFDYYYRSDVSSLNKSSATRSSNLQHGHCAQIATSGEPGSGAASYGSQCCRCHSSFINGLIVRHL